MQCQAAERTRYEEVWGSLPQYATYSPGEQWHEAFMAMTGTTMAGSLLDAGCGTGRAGVIFRDRGFRVSLCDITDVGLDETARDLPFYPICLWDHLRRTVGFYDWVYCTDVMEHLPTEWTMLTLVRLLECCRRGAFFSIALLPDQFGGVLGYPLHQTVQPFTWWRDRLNEVGQVVEARDLLNTGLYLVKPR